MDESATPRHAAASDPCGPGLLGDVPIGAEIRFEEGGAEPVPLPRRAVGYVRVSLSREEMISPGIQEQHILEHCRRRGYVHLGALADLDLSGRSFKKRERIKQAVQMIADGEADVIVVWKWSRFGRNARESMINLGIIENDLGGSVESATEDFDSRTPVGSFQRGFFLQLAEFESDRAGEIWRDVHARRVRQGLTHNGGSRLGYDRGPDGGHVPALVGPDGTPGVGAALAQAYLDYLDGAGFARIAASLNARGFRSRRGNDFNATSVRAAMDSGFAAGLLPFSVVEGRTRSQRFRRGRHEPLIDLATWQAYRQERVRRRAQSWSRPRRPASRLSGIVRCPYCSAAMASHRTGGSRGTPYRFYACGMQPRGTRCPGTSVNAEQLEQHVLEWVQAARDTGSELCRRRQNELRSQLEMTRGQLATLQEELRELQVLHSGPDAEAQVLYQEVLRREPERKRLRDEAQELADQLALLERAGPEVVEQVLQRWQGSPTQDVNRLLRRLLHRIYVFQGRRGVRTELTDGVRPGLGRRPRRQR